MRLLSLTNPIKPLSEVVVITLSLGLLTVGSAEAASFTFTKIADTSTVIPGSNNLTFSRFEGSPVIDDGIVAFVGDSNGSGNQAYLSGIYTSSEGILKTVIDTTTLVPYYNVNFLGFYLGSIDQGNIAFGGYGYKPNNLGGTDAFGIYTVIGGVLERVADRSTILPGDNSNLRGPLGVVSFKDNNVAFYASSDFGNAGLFTNAGGTLQEVVNSSTPLPEVTSSLDSLSNADVVFAFSTSLDNTIYNWRSGIYTYTEGVINRIVDPTTIMLGGRTDFVFNGPVVDGNDLAFGVLNFSYEPLAAIYTIVDGKVNLVADLNTPIPGSLDNFSWYFSLFKKPKYRQQLPNLHRVLLNTFEELITFCDLKFAE